MASSVMLSLPRLMAPASSRRRAAVHSCEEVKYSAVFVPQEVGRPCRWQRSLKATGTPCSGPCHRPAAASASRAFAAPSAPDSSRRMKARIRLSSRRTRSRQLPTASTGDMRRVRMAAAMVTRLRSLILSGVLWALRRAVFQGGLETGRLFGQGQFAGQPLDDAGQVGQLGLPGLLLAHRDPPRPTDRAWLRVKSGPKLTRPAMEAQPGRVARGRLW